MDNTARLIAKHRTNGLLVDTSPLVVFIVGLANPDRVGRHRRTRDYTQHDFKMICDIIGQFSRILTTPNILTEVDNLYRQTDDIEAAKLAMVFDSLTQKLEETYCPSAELVKRSSFSRFGISDTAAMHGTLPCLILTADVRLWKRALDLNLDAININHLRNI